MGSEAARRSRTGRLRGYLWLASDSEQTCAVPGSGRNPVLALVLSAFLPGLGQGYNRQWLKAGAFLVVTPLDAGA